jgi:chromosome partitioning protein
MPHLAMLNTKGGSGKTTAATVIASELVRAGGKVVIIEGDPNAPHAKWAGQRGSPVIEGKDAKIDSADAGLQAIVSAAGDHQLVIVSTGNDNDCLSEWIEAASSWAQFVITDPEGSPNTWMISAMSAADLVIIPSAATSLDAHQVARTLKEVGNTAKIARRTIPYRILLTRVAIGAVVSKDETQIRKSLTDNKLQLMDTALGDRAAFRALFKHGVLLHEIDPATHDVAASGYAAAKENAKAVAREILAVTAKIVQERAAA